MEVQGLDNLRRTSAGLSKQIDTQMKPAVRDTAAEVKERARRNAQQFSLGGFYPAGFRVTSKAGGLSAEVDSRAPTAASIERGRPAGEVVKLGLILRWVERKGLMRSQNVATQRVIRPSKAQRGALARPERAFALAIVDAIKMRGTKPHPHLIPAAEQATSGWRRRTNDAVGRALRTVRGA